MTDAVRESILDYTSGDNTVDPKNHHQHMLKRSSLDLMNSWRKRLSPENVQRILAETSDLWNEAQNTFGTHDRQPADELANQA